MMSTRGGVLQTSVLAPSSDRLGMAMQTKLTDCIPASSRSPSSTAGLSSSTTSPLIKGRPIRPLPKKPLRSRLSPEVAQSIKYPPAPKVSRPLFYPTYDDQDSSVNNEPLNRDLTAAQIRSSEAQKIIGTSPANGYTVNGHVNSSDDENDDEVLRRGRIINTDLASSERAQLNKSVLPQMRNGMKPQRLSAAPSTDSVDDPFENTKNKKKRKIPTGNFQGHQSLSLGMAQMDISSSRNVDGSMHAEIASSPNPGTGNAAQSSTSAGMGKSGVGRGSLNRLPARNASGRSPLGISVNGSNAVHSVRNPIPRRDDQVHGKGNFTSSIKLHLCSTKVEQSKSSTIFKVKESFQAQWPKRLHYQPH